jgi:hypothetical protein
MRGDRGAHDVERRTFEAPDGTQLLPPSSFLAVGLRETTPSTTPEGRTTVRLTHS